MTEPQRSLASCYTGWDAYQRHLVAAIAPLTSEQLALRVSPHSRPVGMLAMHIIQTRAWFFHIRMGEGSADLAPFGLWEDEDENAVPPLRTTAELVAGLEMTWQAIHDVLERWTIADLEKAIPHPEGDDRPVRSRQSMIWHVLEHDMHHGGELTCILDAHGLVGVDVV